MMTNPKAVVTGMGVIAPGARDREAFFQLIINGQSGLCSNNLLKKLGVRSEIAGGVEIPHKELETPDDDEKLIHMAYLAIDEALEDSGLTKTEIASMGTRSGLSISTSVAGHLKVGKYCKNQSDQMNNDPNWLIQVPSFVSQLVSYAGIGGQAFSTMSACAAGTAGAGIALDAVRNGIADLMIVVGTDAIIENTVAGFHSLQSMSLYGCKPFDQNRDGMTLGEGAAAFVVETFDRAVSRGAHIYGELLGYGLGNDAYHITSPDPVGEGACRTMEMALRDAGLKPSDIDYINAHGTATELNDLMEIRAISKIFGSTGKQPSVMISSTKSVTGHCLGAAGSIELAVILLAVDRDVAPPTVFLKSPSKEFQGLRILKDRRTESKIKYAMSNSFAFAGNSASIIVGKI